MTRYPKFIRALFLLGTLTASLNAHAVVGTAATPNVVNLGVLAAPASLNYGNTFTAPTSQQFYDEFTFSLNPAASFSSIVASVDLGSFLGINNISARLYQGTGPFNALSTPLVQAWSAPFSAGSGVTGSTTVISLSQLLAGTYTMQIRGDVVGLAGGSYSGVLNVAAVPEPETYGMLLAGLALVAFAARRKTPAAH